jgi:hypothetical protein
MMNDILETKEGLPAGKIPEVPIFRQFKLDRRSTHHSGTLIFTDGSMYVAVRGKENSSFRWMYFTQLKKEGMVLLVDLLKGEFLKVQSEEIDKIVSGNILHWICDICETHKEVFVSSGAYSALPPVFLKIDTLISQYMVKLNEPIEKNEGN